MECSDDVVCMASLDTDMCAVFMCAFLKALAWHAGCRPCKPRLCCAMLILAEILFHTMVQPYTPSPSHMFVDTNGADNQGRPCRQRGEAERKHKRQS